MTADPHTVTLTITSGDGAVITFPMPLRPTDWHTASHEAIVEAATDAARRAAEVWIHLQEERIAHIKARWMRRPQGVA